MALSLLVPPRTPALSADPNFVVFETNIPTASTRPGFLVSGLASDGDVLNLFWGNTLARLTFATTPDNSGRQLRAAAGQTEEEYRSQLLEGLFSLPIIESAFVITEQPTGVRLTLREASANNLEATSSGVEVLVFGGSGGSSFPNLSAALSVYRVGEVSPIARLEGAFTVGGRTEFNLADLIDTPVGLPPLVTLGSNPTYTAGAVAGFAEYFFRYADQYGQPPQPEKLTKSATYAMVGGGSGGASLLRWGGSGNQVCHAYFAASGRYFAKPIGREQPDYAYIYLDGPRTITPRIIVTLADGTTVTRDVGPAVNGVKGLYCFPSGPLQCGVEEDAKRYAFEFGGFGFRITYDLLPAYHPWNVYLAYDNGAGGIETVGFRGKTEFGYTGSSKEFVRARTRVQGVDQGAIGRYDVEGNDRWRLRSGYLPADYVNHLRQLLLGRVWLIDQTNRRFIAVQVATSSLDLTQDDDDLHALELSVITATPDRGAHNL